MFNRFLSPYFPTRQRDAHLFGSVKSLCCLPHRPWCLSGGGRLTETTRPDRWFCSRTLFIRGTIRALGPALSLGPLVSDFHVWRIPVWPPMPFCRLPPAIRYSYRASP